MARPAIITDEMHAVAQEIVGKAVTARELRQGLSVLLPKSSNITYEQTAQILGIGVATVVRSQRKIRDQVAGKPGKAGPWGGRRRQLLSPDEEEDFLAEWIQHAEHGGVLIVPPIHAALEKRLGRTVSPSTVYRMLARHGWRKVEPDTDHPKRDPEVQETFKKNSRRYWRMPADKTP